MLNLKDYGAVGDGTTDDIGAVNDWITDMRSTGEEGYVPTGVYRCTQRVLFPMPGGGNGKTYSFHGDGAYKSRIDVTDAPNNEGPQVHFYTLDNLPTSCYPSIQDVGFTGNTPNTLAAIGLEDFSDNVGNANFTNVYFYNANSGNSSVAISLQLNYVFDSTFQNIVVIGKVGYGNALDLRLSHFNTFVGGSFSNAGRGIRIGSVSGTGALCNTFMSPDLENVNYGIVCEEDSAESNVFISPYFDIWRPDLSAAGTYAVYSSACASLVIEHPYRTSRSPSPLVDAGHATNVTVHTP